MIHDSQSCWMKWIILTGSGSKGVIGAKLQLQERKNNCDNYFHKSMPGLIWFGKADTYSNRLTPVEMKFCRNLQRVIDITDPEWAPYWTNYKMLKKFLKKLPSLVPADAAPGGAPTKEECHDSDTTSVHSDEGGDDNTISAHFWLGLLWCFCAQRPARALDTRCFSKSLWCNEFGRCLGYLLRQRKC